MAQYLTHPLAPYLIWAFGCLFSLIALYHLASWIVDRHHRIERRKLTINQRARIRDRMAP